MRSIFLLTVMLVACGGKQAPDPLASQRAALLAHQPAETFVAHAALGVDRQLLHALVVKAVAGLEAELSDRPIEGPMGLKLKAKTKVTDQQLDVVQGSCPRCLELELTLTGATQVALGGLSQIIRWRAGIDGELKLSVRVDGADRVLALKPLREWGVETQLTGVPAMMKASSDGAIDGEIHRAIEEMGLTKPMDLFRIPGSRVVLVDDVQVRAEHALEVDTAFSVRRAGVAPKLPDPDGGWVAVVPEETALGVVEAMLLRQPVQQRFAIEVTGLDVQDDSLAIDLKLWRAQNRAAWRSYRLIGALEVRDGRLGLYPQSVDETGREGRWGGLVGLAGKRAVEKRLLRQVELDAPSSVSTQFAGDEITLLVQSIEADDGVLTARGTVE